MRKVSPEGRSKGLMIAFAAAGGVQALARIIGRSTPTVCRYKRVPRKYVDKIAAALELSPATLRDHSPAYDFESTPGENANG